MSLQFDALNPKSAGWTSKRILVRGVQGNVQEVRWLPNDAGIALRTFENIYLVPFHEDFSQSQLPAKKVFQVKRMPRSPIFLSMRDTKHGLIVMTHEMTWEELDEYREFDKRSRVEIQRMRSLFSAISTHEAYFLPYHDGKMGTAVSLRPRNRNLVFLNTLSNGRIAIISAPKDFEEAEPLSANHTNLQDLAPFVPANATNALNSIQIYQTHPNGRAELIATHTAGENGERFVSNWSPNTERILYSTDDGNIFLELPNQNEDHSTFKKISFSKPYEVDSITNLWLNRAQNRFVAASENRLGVWDGEGKPLWTWSTKENETIQSVHFALDGESVLAAINNQVFRIHNGKKTLILTGKHDPQTEKIIKKAERLKNKRLKKYKKTQQLKNKRLKKYKKRQRHHFEEDLFSQQRSFIDGIIPLSDGSIAFAVVTSDYEERSAFAE